MKTKLEMAHEFMLVVIKAGCSDGPDLLDRAWQYADAMQVEADKRSNKERLDVSLTKDKDGSCLHFHHEFGHKTCMDCGDSLEEWQPDWSQAPDDACCWFVGGNSWDVKPYWSKYIPCYKDEYTQTTWQGDGMIEAPSFGYQGDWRDSLRKRPQ